MKLQKKLNLLNEANNSKLVARKWNTINDQSNANGNVGNDYSNAYILVRGDVTIVGDNETQLEFKNCVPFIKCITKSDGTTTSDVEDLDLIMPRYNLLEFTWIVLTQQVVYSFTPKMKQIIFMLILRTLMLLNLLSIRLNN